jgi:hypothetical protein
MTKKEKCEGEGRGKGEARGERENVTNIDYYIFIF